MPIYAGADNIIPLQIGKVTVVSGWVGDSKVYEYDSTQVLTLTSTTDFDLKTFIDASGADYAKPIIITLASDQIIGGVNAAAFTIAGLPAHSTITININGQVQGAVSGNAVITDEAIDVISSGQIAGGIIEGVDVDDALITFVVTSTGKVLAGGGNGGNGGRGGDGSDAGDFGNFRFNRTSGSLYAYRDGGQAALYANQNVGYPVNNSVYLPGANQDPDHVYQRGDYVSDNTISFNSGDEYKIARADFFRGTAGSGGAGGLGQGYGQSQTNGADGTIGTHRSGNGGKGGNGGDWGVDGSAGNTGITGLYIDPFNFSETRAGAAGVSGSNAGYSFFLSGTGMRIYTANSPQAKALNI